MLTIDAIIESAKKQIMTTGQHIPMIIADFSEGDGWMLAFQGVKEVGDSLETHMFLTARRKAIKQTAEQSTRRMVRVVWICEANMARTPIEEAAAKFNNGRPSLKELATHKKALIIEVLDCSGDDDAQATQDVHILEILETDPVDLLPYHVDDDDYVVRSPICIAFVAGYRSAKHSDEKLLKKIRKFSAGQSWQSDGKTKKAKKKQGKGKKRC